MRREELSEGERSAQGMTAPRAMRIREQFLPFAAPLVGAEEVEGVVQCVRSGWLTTGPRTAELERRFAEYVGAKHAIALSSGTAALHCAYWALGLKRGDEVIRVMVTLGGR